MSTHTPQSLRPFHVVGEGMYLASSWTWCIGMFLPIILLRDMGAWSWLAFAIPNVVGAAMMGPVLAARGHSEALTRAHAPAMRLFSIVTLAFQVYFLAWILVDLPREIRLWLLAIVFVVIVLSGRHGRNTRWSRIAVIITYFVSAALGAFYVSQVGLPSLPATIGPMARDLAFLAPVCLLGFALCPYLDLSFHAVRQRTPGREGTLAFIIGFGVFFLSMIVLTLAYAPSVLAAVNVAPAAAGWLPGASVATPLTGAGWAILAHLTVQASITAAIHQGFARLPDAAPTPSGEAVDATPTSRKLLASLGVLAPVSVILAPVVAVLSLPGYAGLTMHEIAYRCFLAFYGLLAPAYAWTCMMPSWSAPAAPQSKHLRALAIAIVCATPFYWFGFIERQYAALAAGVMVILASRLIAWRR